MIDLHIIIDAQPDGSLDIRRTGTGIDPTDAENLLANALCNAIEHTAKEVAKQLKTPVCEEGVSFHKPEGGKVEFKQTI